MVSYNGIEHIVRVFSAEMWLLLYHKYLDAIPKSYLLDWNNIYLNASYISLIKNSVEIKILYSFM